MKNTAKIIYVFIVATLTILHAIIVGADKVYFEFLDATIEIAITDKFRMFILFLISIFLSSTIFLK